MSPFPFLRGKFPIERVDTPHIERVRYKDAGTKPRAFNRIASRDEKTRNPRTLSPADDDFVEPQVLAEQRGRGARQRQVDARNAERKMP